MTTCTMTIIMIVKVIVSDYKANIIIITLQRTWMFTILLLSFGYSCTKPALKCGHSLPQTTLNEPEDNFRKEDCSRTVLYLEVPLLQYRGDLLNSKSWINESLQYNNYKNKILWYSHRYFINNYYNYVASSVCYWRKHITIQACMFHACYSDNNIH